MSKLRIHERFKKLHRKLTPEESDQLEANMLAEGGCHDPICIWRGVIIDGHNRHSICEKHGLPFSVKRFDDQLPDEEAVVQWIIDQQLGRRNLTEQEASYLRGKKLESTAASPISKGGDTRAAGQNGQPKDQKEKLSNATKAEAAEQIGTAAGVSAKTVRRDEKRAQRIDKLVDSIRDPYLRGELGLTDKQITQLSSLSTDEQSKLARTARTTGQGWNEILGIDCGSDGASVGTHDRQDAPKSVEDRMKEHNRKVRSWANSMTALMAQAPDSPWLNEGRKTIIHTQLKSAAQNARLAVSEEVCPDCEGEGCKTCRQVGFMPTREVEKLG